VKKGKKRTAEEKLKTVEGRRRKNKKRGRKWTDTKKEEGKVKE
jgi:hypothetical protein